VRPARDDGAAGVLQQGGKPLAGGLVGEDAILVAVDHQDGDADLGEVCAEVFLAGGDTGEGGLGGCGDGDVEAVLPRLVADPGAAQEIDVLGVVQEVFHRGRPVGGDTRRETLENAPVNAFRTVVRLEQERQQRRHQHGCPDPP
jgi:hypothetical protein